ncbi:MAG TPA: pseudouridine synthase [Polyangiaceae bacterium]|nr:pseudouridine synthase [Polyangiaceae bacterium]
MSEPVIRWVASGNERAVADIVTELGASGVEALAGGRVFVDGRRVTELSGVVRAGSVLEVYAARNVERDVTLLAEHAGFVFVDKPAGIATEPDHAGVAASLVARVAERLGVARSELHALSRLDVGVSGVVTLARSPEAREQAAALRERGAWHRRYVALARCAPEPSRGIWDQALARPRAGRSGRHAERAASTRFAHLGAAGPVFVPSRAGNVEVRPALLALAPVTGRTHQLRMHAAGGGAPLLGDATYGGPERLVLANGAVRPLERVALHAAWVELELRGQKLHIGAPIPADLDGLWRDLGGEDEGWARALELEL